MWVKVEDREYSKNDNSVCKDKEDASVCIVHIRKQQKMILEKWVKFRLYPTGVTKEDKRESIKVTPAAMEGTRLVAGAYLGKPR